MDPTLPPQTGGPAIEQLGMFDNFAEIAETHIAALWHGSYDYTSYTWSLVATTTFVLGDGARQSGGRFNIAPTQRAGGAQFPEAADQRGQRQLQASRIFE